MLKIKQTVKEKRKSDADFDLGFNCFQMRHIYKMTFDRIRNVQLIGNISVLIIMLTTVFIDFMCFTGKLGTYFMIPREAYIYVILLLVSLVTFVNIGQIFMSRRHEGIVADVSYKSRYVISDSLNELLTEDIEKGVVREADIVRGINQAEVALFTAKEKKLKKELKCIEKTPDPLNRRMVHHEVIANRRRLPIVVWLTFLAVTSILVWMCKVYWLFPIFLVLAVAINIVGHVYFLELLERKRIIRNIHALERFDKKNEAK